MIENANMPHEVNLMLIGGMLVLMGVFVGYWIGQRHRHHEED